MITLIKELEGRTIKTVTIWSVDTDTMSIEFTEGNEILQISAHARVDGAYPDAIIRWQLEKPTET